MYGYVRLYGDTINTWWVEGENGRRILRQAEVEYMDYNLDNGTLAGTGTEDFSAERYKTLITKLVWTWDGKRENAGGKRWFEYDGRAVKYKRGDGRSVKKLLKIWYEKAKEIELR